MSKVPEVIVRRATRADSEALALCYRSSYRDNLPFLPILHTPEADIEFFREKVLPENEVYVACTTDGRVVGLIAYDSQWVNQLYLLTEFMYKGIGSQLLALAKQHANKLQLWAFQKNIAAQSFYAKHGFIEIKRTDGVSNEEKEPDILHEWKREND